MSRTLRNVKSSNRNLNIGFVHRIITGNYE